ncbi:MAG: methyltransferase [Gemmatirosa sp.]
MSAVSSPTAALPIHPDAPLEAFAAVRTLFERARFDEPTVARRLEGPNLYGFPRLAEGRRTLAGPVEDANAALVRLFLDGDPLDAGVLEATCGRNGAEQLTSLGLVAEAGEGQVQASVLLVPLEGLWLASDIPPVRRRLKEGSEPKEFVFPPANQLTRQFLDMFAPTPGQRMIELCAGSGIAALRALRGGAAEAWATDLAGRSVQFARFNARLNGLDSLVAVESDAWAGVEGETFDFVCAHPPYVPTLAHEFDYRDGGEDGEQVTRGVVQGLPAHLRPGGRCAITCALSDRRGEPTPQRIRGWLGDAADEFEIVVLRRRDWDVLHAYRNVAGDGAATYRDAERWLRHFDALGIERFALCSFELRRERRTLVPVAEQHAAGTQLDAATIDWRFRWAHHALAHPDALSRLAGQPPRVAPGARLSVQLRADADRDWVTQGSTVDVDWPVGEAVRLPPLGPTLMELCDGTRDVPAILEALRAAGLVEDDVQPLDLARLIELLCTVGALELPACPLPPRPRDALAGDNNAEWKRAIVAPIVAPAGAAAQAETTASSSVPTQSTRQ